MKLSDAFEIFEMTSDQNVKCDQLILSWLEAAFHEDNIGETSVCDKYAYLRPHAGIYHLRINFIHGMHESVA